MKERKKRKKEKKARERERELELELKCISVLTTSRPKRRPKYSEVQAVFDAFLNN